ncbi:MAG: response regulator [Roseiflexaceae bacterium]|nr:response regulator [Roseiflexaceae bacterium]
MHEPPHILIIDADSSAASVTRTLVERVDPHAIVAVESTAERGQLSALRHRPDILIIDPSPHNRSDEELVKQLKLHDPGVRIIVLTSSSTLLMRRRMDELGIDLYIEKLTAPTPLIDGLRSLLATRT